MHKIVIDNEIRNLLYRRWNKNNVIGALNFKNNSYMAKEIRRDAIELGGKEVYVCCRY